MRVRNKTGHARMVDYSVSTRRQAGIAFVEFVIVAPLMLLIVAGSIQIALLYLQRALVLDSLEVVATSLARDERVCQAISNSAVLTAQIQGVLQTTHSNFLLGANLFDSGPNLGLAGFICLHPTTGESKLDLWLRYSLPCPFCRVMSLGSSSGRFETLLRHRVIPERAPVDLDPLCVRSTRPFCT